MAARSAREAAGPRRRCRKRRTPRTTRSPVLATTAAQEPAAWDPAQLYMLAPFTCPTCRGVYLSVSLEQQYCSLECERLDPRRNPPKNGDGTVPVSQPDPLAPLPWEGAARFDRFTGSRL
jgi:hypothetical protein